MQLESEFQTIQYIKIIPSVKLDHSKISILKLFILIYFILLPNHIAERIQTALKMYNIKVIINLYKPYYKISLIMSTKIKN